MVKIINTNRLIISKQLDIVTRFSKDTGVHYGEDNYAYLCIEKVTTVKSVPVEVNQLKTQPIDGGDRYRYLGINKNISYSGMQNKEKVIR